MGIAMPGIRSSNPSIPAVTGIETPLPRRHYRDWSQTGISTADSQSALWLRRVLNFLVAGIAVIGLLPVLVFGAHESSLEVPSYLAAGAVALLLIWLLFAYAARPWAQGGPVPEPVDDRR